MKKDIKIGLIGLGTVGRGIVSVLKKDAGYIKDKTGISIEIAKIADIDLSRGKDAGVGADLLTKDAYEIINDPSISIVVEAIGGEKPALDFALASLKAGKHFVTTNKELIAKHGQKILTLARERSLRVLFEGSVGGGIPILSQLRQGLSANRIEEIFGIVNGTTNYILSRMTEENMEFSQALKLAQERGFAEKDPKNDIEGYDASYKAAILASAAFDAKIKWEDVPFEGINKVSLEDVEFARDMGYVIKLLAVAKRDGNFIDVSVHPTLISAFHPLSAVKDAFNAIYVKGSAVGQVMFYGEGAGSLPTASAAIADIIEIASANGIPYYPELKEIKVKNADDIEGKYYIRLRADDKPGVLAAIAGAFGEKNVSIKSALQKETIDNAATIVIITHNVNARNFSDAIKKISGLSAIKEVGSVIRVGMES
ncbi:MAG: homoserine dehydrogenase [Candidatus Margulisiibacteriota bacterium]